MKERSLTRRHFVAGCAGLGAVAICGAAPIRAFAEGGHIGVDARPEWESIHAICQACPNACGFTAYTVDEKLGKTIGDAYNPNSVGNLCAIGYGYTQSFASDAKINNPLRKKPNGEFQTISWDEAFDEIGERIDVLVEKNGPDSIAMIYDGAYPNARNYSNLLMNGLGSGRVYVDDLTVDVVKSAAFEQIIGVDGYHSDVNNADAILLIDTSFADMATPDLVASLQDARDRGAKIISLDPRLGMLASMADDWYAVNPGTELAVLLAVCRQIIRNGKYDKSYMDANVSNFDLWVQALRDYSPQWAEEVSGVQSFRIDELASYLLDAAPKVAIELGNGDVAGISYMNSTQTAKVVCLLNALLGAWGVEGGALLPFDYDPLFAPYGLDELPGSENVAMTNGLQRTGVVTIDGVGAAETIDDAARGQIKALITANADVAYDYSSVASFADVAKGLDLLVCITDEMTSTAQEADYILPLRSYLSADTLPACLQGEFAGMAMGSAVVAPKDGDNSLPMGDIIDGIAEATNIDIPISTIVKDASLGRLAAIGLDEDALALNGTAEIEASRIDRVAAWPTPSGKIECVDTAAPEELALPVWSAPLGTSTVEAVISDDMNLGQRNEVSIVVDGDGSPIFHLITGPQSVIGMHGYNVKELTDISEKYQLDRVWINSDVAELYGIRTGDKVVLHNDRYSGEAEAFVTGRIVPSALYLPISFGRTSSKQKNSYNVGLNPMLFADAVLNLNGALCIQEACVGIEFEKEGA